MRKSVKSVLIIFRRRTAAIFKTVLSCIKNMYSLVSMAARGTKHMILWSTGSAIA